MSNKPSGEQVVAQALQFIGRKYSEMDCQAMVEAAVRACGGKMSYTGSNAMARAVEHLVPLSQAQKEGLRVGAALFIHEDGGSYPQKYHADGLGNFSHVGLYAGENALEDVDKNGKKRVCNVVHSSASMGRVAGSTLRNGWTHVGYFREIDCGQIAASDTDQRGAAQTEKAAARKTLRRGDKGEQVVHLQEWLNALGSTLEADGIFGAATQTAVKSFQRQHGLAVDGIVGAKTWAALEAAVQIVSGKTYTVCISGLDAATATYLLECYQDAVCTEEMQDGDGIG